MKRRLFFAVLATFTTESIWAVDYQSGHIVNSFGGGPEKSIATAMDVLARAFGKSNRFLYDELRTVIKLGRSGDAPTETSQDRLDKRLIHLETRLAGVLKRCGPGVREKENKDDLLIEDRSLGWRFPAPNLPIFPPFGLNDQNGTAGRISEPLIGQTIAEDLGMGPDGASIIGPIGLPGSVFAQSGHIALGHWDPLGASNHGSAFRRRRRRYAKGERVTRAKINKKLQRLNASFEPMETFLDTQLENCSPTRVAVLKAKVSKVKARVEKVVTRQGESLLRRQRKKTKRN